jgi:hypothetical protein
LKTVDPGERRLAESLFRAKSERRLELAALPIRDKIRMLLELQRLANADLKPVLKPE